MNDPGPYVTMGTLWPSPSRRATSTCPARIMVSPGPTWPTFANAAPASYERTLPNRRTRSISNGSRTGNIWSRRVSMIDGEVGMILGRVLRWAAPSILPQRDGYSLVVSHRNAPRYGFRTDYDRGVL